MVTPIQRDFGERFLRHGYGHAASIPTPSGASRVVHKAVEVAAIEQEATYLAAPKGA
jgi:hypothetical protein